MVVRYHIFLGNTHIAFAVKLHAQASLEIELLCRLSKDTGEKQPKNHLVRPAECIFFSTCLKMKFSFWLKKVELRTDWYLPMAKK